MSDGALGYARRLMAAALLMPSLYVLGTTPAMAGEPLPASWIKRWIGEEPATGNWFGLRDALNDWGIKPRMSYATDLMANVAGGQRRGEAYAGQLAVDITADLGKLAGLEGLTFNVGTGWLSGTDLSRDIGNTFTVAQYFEGQQLRLTQMSLQQSLFDRRVDVKAGRFSTGADFLTSPIDFTFVNGALNPILLAVQQNVPSITTYPDVTWAGRIVTQPTAALSLSAGAFYSDPTLNQLTANGTEFGISSSAGYLVIGEAAYLVNGESGAWGMPGRYRVGAYYDSNQYAFLDNPGRQQRGNYGVYAMGEQMVFRLGGPGSVIGLSLFGALIYAPQASINRMPWFASAGASYQGLVPGRDRDTAAFALYYGGFSRDLPGKPMSWCSSGRMRSPSAAGSPSSLTSST